MQMPLMSPRFLSLEAMEKEMLLILLYTELRMKGKGDDWMKMAGIMDRDGNKMIDQQW